MNTGQDYLKPAEIADLAALPEAEVRGYLADHPELFRCRTIGPVRLYHPKAVETVRTLAEAARNNRDLEAERAVAEAAAGIAVPDEDTPPSPAVQAYFDARDLKDVVARQALEIEALRREITGREEALSARIALLEETLRKEREKTSLIAEWVDYFDSEISLLKRPFLERILGKKG
ncbi:hypothetical protein [Methanofollis fontis]|nr:hypothetical protein [Methanofollis fontis]